MREHGSEVLPTRHESGQPELSTVCAQRVRWGPLVMRGVSLIGVSQAEAGYTVTVTVTVSVCVVKEVLVCIE